MASRKILVQLDIAAASELTSPLSGFVGFSAKADGLYQKIGTSPELRLLTSADVQNAILADGSITGAVSQAQTFTLGVKLSNLTQGYIPYASGATKLLSNSPIYTDGTNVGIGKTDPGAKLDVNGSIISKDGGTYPFFGINNNNYNGWYKLGTFSNLVSHGGGVAEIYLRTGSAYNGDRIQRIFGTIKLRWGYPGVVDVSSEFSEGNMNVGYTASSDASTVDVYLNLQLGWAFAESYKVEIFGNNNISWTNTTQSYISGTPSNIVASSVILSTNNSVGIGTQSPQAKLDVAGGDIIAEQNIFVRHLEGKDWNDASTNGDLYLQWINNTRNTIINGQGGSVGIGTTDPGAQLTINNNYNPVLRFNVTGGEDGAESGRIEFFQSNYSPTYARASIRAQRTGSSSNGRLIFATSNSTNLAPTDRMIIDESGNVGIGTADPQARLSIANPTAGSQRLLYLGEPGYPSGSGGNAYGLSLYGNSSDGVFKFYGMNAGVETANPILSMSRATGNVGIGTPTPNQQLEITQNFRLPSTAGTTPYGIIYKGTTPFIHDFNYGNNGTVTTIGRNTFVGLNAGNFTMGSTATRNYQASDNTGIGSSSLYSNTTGYNNTANGYSSLNSNTTGYQNTANGYASLNSNTTGNQNTALGANSGRYIADGATGRTTGNNGLYLGYNSKASADGTDNEIVIGYNAIGAGSNKTVLGNSSVTDTYFGSSTGSSKLWASALNLSGLTASKVVFTDGSKNLTSTGIGTASQFIKGDGSLDSNTYITSGTISGFVPYTGANDDVDLGTFSLTCSQLNSYSAIIGGIQIFTDYIQEDEVGIYHDDGYKIAAFNTMDLIYLYGGGKLRISGDGDVDIDKSITIGNKITSQYTDGGYLYVQTTSTSYAQLSFYSKDTFNDFGIVQIIANPEEGIILRSLSNDYSSDSYLEIMQCGFGFYTNQQKRLEIAQNGSINAFGNTITSTGGFIGNASTATKLQTARTITVGNQSLPFDGTADLTYSLANIGVPTGSGVAERITFWNGSNSLSSSPYLMWYNDYNTLSTHSINLAYNFKLGSSTTAGYVLTADANGNGTWQAPTGSIIGSGVSDRVTFWNGTNSLSSSNDLWWNDMGKILNVTGSIVVSNSIKAASALVGSVSTELVSTNGFRLLTSITAGYVLTTDAYGNGTWQAPPTGGGFYTDARYNTAGGIRAGLHLLIDAERNTFLGYEAGRENTTGSYNTFLGYEAGLANTSGEDNTAIGSVSLANNTSGYQNTAIGKASLISNLTGHDNTATGYYSLVANTIGNQNTAEGAYALYLNTTGNSNSAQGAYALYHNTTGNVNTAQGVNAGRYLGDGITARTTGDNGLYLGYDSRASANGTINEIVIGSGAIGNGTNTITLGNDGILKTILKGRLKLKTVPSVYADNSSAITGGLSAGEIYRTSIGVLMIVY